MTSIKEALEQAEAAFEAIRLILINNLEEPERTAFWMAVSGRDKTRAALATFQPDGERLEAIARIIDPEAFENWDRAEGNWRKDKARVKCWDAEAKADLIFASGLVQENKK